MSKDENNLEEQLKDVQHALIKPSGKVLQKLTYYLNLLNPLAKNDKNQDAGEKKGNTKVQKYNNITWIDIENPSRKEINQLAEEYPFHPLHLESCLLKGQLAQVEKEDKYLFILLHMPSYDEQEDKIITTQLCLFLGKNYLVSVHTDYLYQIRDLLNSCEGDKEQCSIFFSKSSGYLLYNIIDTLVKDISTLLKNTLQETDGIEDIVFDVRVSAAYKISKLRQKIIRLRRVTDTFKNIIDELAVSQGDYTHDSMARYYKNLNKTVNKLREMLDEAKETVEIYKDADFTVSTDKSNQILAVLTLIFTFTIPATIVGTFYGMNILLPGGLEDGSWTFFGPYTTFYIVIAISISSIVLMYWYFKIKNWF